MGKSKPKRECCSMCGRLIPIEYKRRITAKMACGLINLWRAVGGEPYKFIHTQGSIVVDKGGDFAKLRFWDLVEPLVTDRGDGSTRTGIYCLTLRGQLFAENKLPVRKYLWVFNDVPIGQSDEYILIKQALRAKFNYEELIGLEPKQ